ncbi:hypothetical protein EQV77_08025 [Halobacillus fulvus]|nr:hypothetical protein EQV77_08025 [Halobacillus fulvus]
MTSRKTFFLVFWLLFIGYAWLIAPNGDQGYLNQLITMDDPDPLLLTVFSLLGIFPMAFATILLNQDDSRVPVWPFVIGSFMLGAFALIPYFFLSSTKGERNSVRTPGIIRRFLNARVYRFILLTGTIALVIYGLTAGSFALYQQAFETSQFVHVMTIDFFVLAGLSVFVIYWNERKKGIENQLFWLGFVPVVGFLAYIAIEKRKSM